MSLSSYIQSLIKYHQPYVSLEFSCSTKPWGYLCISLLYTAFLSSLLMIWFQTFNFKMKDRFSKFSFCSLILATINFPLCTPFILILTHFVSLPLLWPLSPFYASIIPLFLSSYLFLFYFFFLSIFCIYSLLTLILVLLHVSSHNIDFIFTFLALSFKRHKYVLANLWR